MARPAPKTRHLRLLDKPHDPRMQQALELMHGELSQRWTVTKLAKRVGLSRPAFARKFVDSTGCSPVRYLTAARMKRAAELLHTTRDGLAQIGAQVGYESEFAFNRAFKRAYRVAPGTFRKLGAVTMIATHASPTPCALRRAA